MWSVIGMSWNLLSGYCGQVSFGHAAFFGIGAYTAGLLYAKLGVSAWWGMVATVPVAGRRRPRHRVHLPAPARAVLRARDDRRRGDPAGRRREPGRLHGGRPGHHDPRAHLGREDLVLLHHPRARGRDLLVRRARRGLPARLLLRRDPRGPGRRREPRHRHDALQDDRARAQRRARRLRRGLLHELHGLHRPEGRLRAARHLDRGDHGRHGRRRGHALGADRRRRDHDPARRADPHDPADRRGAPHRVRRPADRRDHLPAQRGRRRRREAAPAAAASGGRRERAARGAGGLAVLRRSRRADATSASRSPRARCSA